MPTTDATGAPVLLWTPSYSSPEQAAMRPITPASDVYSLGLILWELLSGKPAAVPGKDLAETIEIVCRTPIDCKGFPEPLRSVLQQSLEKLPENRLPSARVLASQLRQISSQSRRPAVFNSRVISRTGRRAKTVPGLLLASVLCSLFVLTGLAAAWLYSGDSYREFPPQLLTSKPGPEAFPALSPNGQRVAYTADGDVWIQEIATGQAELVCCSGEFWAQQVDWSPDGRSIAINYMHDGKWRIELLDLATRSRRPFGGGGPGIKWRRDARAILIPRQVSTGSPIVIFEKDADSGVERQLSFPPTGYWGDIAVAESFDGKQIAVARYRATGNGDLYVAARGEIQLRQVTKLDNWIVGLDWLPNNEDLVFGGSANGISGLFLADSGSGSIQFLEGTGGNNRNPDVQLMANGQVRIVYMNEYWNLDLHTLAPGAPPRSIAVSRNADQAPSLGDSGRLVFESARRGSFDIWTCTGDCKAPKQVTHHRYPEQSMCPGLSPDEKYIAYIQRVGSRSALTLVGIDGSASKVIFQSEKLGSPTWSADGRYIYFRWDRHNAPRIWKVSAHGEGEPVAATDVGFVRAAESSDGQWLYTTRGEDNAELFRRRLADGRTEAVVAVGSIRGRHWAIGGRDIFYWKTDGEKGFHQLWRFREQQNRSEIVYRLPSGHHHIAELAANANGEVVWSDQEGSEVDIWSIDLAPRRKWLFE